MTKFPKVLYVKRERESGGHEYFIAAESAEGLAEMGEKFPLAIYELKSVGSVEGVAKVKP